MKSYDRILRAVYSIPWAIQPEKLEAIIGFLQLKAAGGAPDVDTLAAIREASAAAAQRATGSRAGTVAVLPLLGMISHRASMMTDISGGTSIDKFTASFRQAVQDPNVKAIVLDVDSPGGSVDGVPELAAEILAARGTKPIVAVANTLMASAAYWIGSAAGDLVASPSAMVGSVGVYAAHEDISKALEAEGVKVTLISAGKYKTEGNAYEPLNDGARQAMQTMVDEFYGNFVKAVAAGRGVAQKSVREGFGEGRVVSAQQALKGGMIDRVATLDEVLAKYGVSRGATMSAEAIAEVKAEAQAEAKAETEANALEAELAAAPDTDSSRRDIELRRRQLQFAAL